MNQYKRLKKDEIIDKNYRVFDCETRITLIETMNLKKKEVFILEITFKNRDFEIKKYLKNKRNEELKPLNNKDLIISFKVIERMTTEIAYILYKRKKRVVDIAKLLNQGYTNIYNKIKMKETRDEHK